MTFVDVLHIEGEQPCFGARFDSEHLVDAFEELKKILPENFETKGRFEGVYSGPDKDCYFFRKQTSEGVSFGLSQINSSGGYDNVLTFFCEGKTITGWMTYGLGGDFSSCWKSEACIQDEVLSRYHEGLIYAGSRTEVGGLLWTEEEIEPYIGKEIDLPLTIERFGQMMREGRFEKPELVLADEGEFNQFVSLV